MRGLKETLQKQLAEVQNSRTGVVVDGHLRVKGTAGTIFCLGDAAVTHQVRVTGRGGGLGVGGAGFLSLRPGQLLLLHCQVVGCAALYPALWPSLPRPSVVCCSQEKSLEQAAQLFATIHPHHIATPPFTYSLFRSFRLLLQEKSLEQAAQLFASADKDGDQRLSRPEVCRMLKKVRPRPNLLPHPKRVVS